MESTIIAQYASTGTASGQNGFAASRPSVKATICPMAAPSSSIATSDLPPPDPFPARQIRHGHRLEHHQPLARERVDARVQNHVAANDSQSHALTISA